MNLRLLLLLFPLALASCTVYKEYPIEVYKPGEVALSSTAKSAAVVYRNFKYNEDTLQHYFKDDYRLRKVKNDPENLDSILVTASLNELATHLKSNNTFDEVRILPYHTFERHTGEHLPDLPADLIEQITSTIHVDLLISLETFSWFFSRYPENFETPESNEVITVAVWGIYDPASKKRLERKTMIDTVFWNGYDNQGNFQKGYKPPPRLTALELASALAGKNYAKRFYATWQTVNRMYSVPPLPDFSDAAFYFEEGKWDQAIALWRKYAEDKNGKMAINARYNLALAYEMKDDLETAQKWLAAAFKLASKYKSRNDLNTILTYQKILDARRKELLKLNRLIY